VKKFFVPVLVAWAFTFATTGSAEVVRLQSKLKGANLTEIPQNVPATISALSVSTPSPELSSGKIGSRHHSSASSSLADVPLLFLPVTITPEVTTVDASGEKTGRRFKNSETVISIPDINFAPVPLSAVPEPASTSVVLIGLFGTGMFFIRRHWARKA